jgi:hypothetical protein
LILHARKDLLIKRRAELSASAQLRQRKKVAAAAMTHSVHSGFMLE